MSARSDKRQGRATHEAAVATEDSASDGDTPIVPLAPAATPQEPSRKFGKIAFRNKTREAPTGKLTVVLPLDMIDRVEALMIVTKKSKNQIVFEALSPVVKGVRLPSVVGDRDQGTREGSAA